MLSDKLVWRTCTKRWETTMKRTTHKLYTRALADNEENHGPDHPHTLATANTLAILLRNEGEYDETLKLC